MAVLRLAPIRIIFDICEYVWDKTSVMALGAFEIIQTISNTNTTANSVLILFETRPIRSFGQHFVHLWEYCEQTWKSHTAIVLGTTLLCYEDQRLACPLKEDRVL